MAGRRALHQLAGQCYRRDIAHALAPTWVLSFTAMPVTAGQVQWLSLHLLLGYCGGPCATFPTRLVLSKPQSVHKAQWAPVKTML